MDQPGELVLSVLLEDRPDVRVVSRVSVIMVAQAENMYVSQQVVCVRQLYCIPQSDGSPGQLESQRGPRVVHLQLSHELKG